MSNSQIIWTAHERYTEEADITLICFPYAGGSATYFAPLKSKIDKRINICPVLYPGREKNMKIPFFDTIKKMAEQLVLDNEKLFRKRYALMGHCTGSLIAYETALAAERIYGTRPEVFIASSAPAPSCKQFFDDMNYTDDQLTDQLINSHMIDRSFAENDMFSSYYLPLIKKDLEMHMRYRPHAPYKKMDTSVFVMYGDEDSLFSDSEPINRWSDHITGKVRSMAFHGGHFYLDKNREQAGQFISDLLLDTERRK